jgi:preprotein translocase subunit YajC
MTGIAYAQGVAAAPAAGGLGPFGQFVPLVLIFIVFYFLLIRPQQTKAKQHQQFLSDMKKGDKVLTGGGIHGKITGLTDSTITMEIADGVRVKVNRGSVLTTASATDNQAAVKKS